MSDSSSPSSALVKQPNSTGSQLIAHGNEWEAMKEQAEILAKSGFLPSHLDTGAKVLTVMMYGRDLGIPAQQAVTSIYVVNGKPSLSAELMLSLAYKNLRGFTFEVNISTTELCKVTACRPNGKPVTIAFSMEDARRAGLAGSATWKKYPAQMLRARATSAVLRVVAPDAIRGVYTPEELGHAERDVEVDALAKAHNTELPPTGVNVQEVVDNG